MASVNAYNCRLYYNETGKGGTGAWVEFSNIKNLTQNLTAGEADVTTRAGDGYKATEPTLIDASVEFQSVYDASDAHLAIFQAAFIGRTRLGIRVLTGDPTVDAEGIEADMKVTAFTRNEQIEDAVTIDITMKPCYSADAPEWVELP